MGEGAPRALRTSKCPPKGSLELAALDRDDGEPADIEDLRPARGVVASVRLVQYGGVGVKAVLSALAHLTYGLVRASLTYPLRAGRGGRRFLAAYGAEGLLPMSAEHRAVAAAFERCLGCGLCELAVPDEPRLHDLARSLWRSPLATETAVAWLARLGAEDLAAAEAACPAGVPFAELAEHLGATSGRGRRELAATRQGC